MLNAFNVLLLIVVTEDDDSEMVLDSEYEVLDEEEEGEMAKESLKMFSKGKEKVFYGNKPPQAKGVDLANFWSFLSWFIDYCIWWCNITVIFPLISGSHDPISRSHDHISGSCDLALQYVQTSFFLVYFC